MLHTTISGHLVMGLGEIGEEDIHYNLEFQIMCNHLHMGVLWLIIKIIRLFSIYMWVFIAELLPSMFILDLVTDLGEDPSYLFSIVELK